MSYTVKIEREKKIIKGYHIPNGQSCKCKAHDFYIELPNTATQEQISEIIKLITNEDITDKQDN